MNKYTILNYAENQMKTFEELPFNEVDSLILSWLIYIHFPTQIKDLIDYSGVRLQDLLCRENFTSMFDLPVSPQETKQLFFLISTSPRFRNIIAFRYEPKMDYRKTMQYASITFKLKDGLYFVAYRGTDASFIGWKEDFDMVLLEPIPSQDYGREYLEEIASHVDGRIIVGGHSKGGNIAVYSASQNIIKYQNKIEAIYSFDGPGFNKQLLQSEEFIKARPFISKYTLQGSLFGMLFNPEAEFQIIYSNAFGFNQHNPFSWEIENNHFVYLDEGKKLSKILYTSANELSERLNEDEKRILINAIFETLNKTNADSFHGFSNTLPENIPIIIQEIKDFDKDTIRLILSTMKLFASISVENIPQIIFNDEKKEL